MLHYCSHLLARQDGRVSSLNWVFPFKDSLKDSVFMWLNCHCSDPHGKLNTVTASTTWWPKWVNVFIRLLSKGPAAAPELSRTLKVKEETTLYYAFTERCKLQDAFLATTLHGRNYPLGLSHGQSVILWGGDHFPQGHKTGKEAEPGHQVWWVSPMLHCHHYTEPEQIWGWVGNSKRNFQKHSV